MLMVLPIISSPTPAHQSVPTAPMDNLQQIPVTPVMLHVKLVSAQLSTNAITAK